MQDFHVVQSLKASYYLDNNLPDMFFLHKLLIVLALADPLKNITIIGIIHHDTKKDKC